MAIAAARPQTGVPLRPRPATRFRRAFTLLEMLVVLIVVGIGASVVALQLGHDTGAVLRQESERLRTALEYAAQLAQWRREPLVWEGEAQGYRFLRPDDKGEWREEVDHELVRHALPEAMRLRATGAAGTPIPQRLLFRASGRNEPYTVVVDTDHGAWVIKADPLNRVVAAPAQ